MTDADKKLWTFHQTDNAAHMTGGHPRQDLLYKNINRVINNGKVLEIGFGDGYLLGKLSKKQSCWGADISPENVEQMKKRIPGVRFDLMLADGKLPYEDDFFDGFVASEVLEHMTNEELATCVDEMWRILKKGGYGFLTFPAREHLQDNECYCPNCGTRFHKWGHKQSWNPASIHNVFSKFEIKKIKEFFTPYRGKNIFEFVGGFGMYVLRTTLNTFFDVGNKTYLVILKK